MKAAYIEGYGKAAALIVGERPEPELRERDVLIQVHAAGVNAIDNKIKAGEFKQILPYTMPLVLGCDGAGVVARVGPSVTRFRPGDEVYACVDQTRIGTFAEAIAMDETMVARKPASLSMEEAASLPVVALTAWQVLVERAGLQGGAEGVHPGRIGRGGLDHDPARQAPRRHRGHDLQHPEHRAGPQPRRGRGG